jgi:hypothetical protein
MGAAAPGGAGCNLDAQSPYRPRTPAFRRPVSTADSAWCRAHVSWHGSRRSSGTGREPERRREAVPLGDPVTAWAGRAAQRSRYAMSWALNV